MPSRVLYLPGEVPALATSPGSSALSIILQRFLAKVGGGSSLYVYLQGHSSAGKRDPGALARCQDWPSTVDVSSVLRHTQALCPVTSLGF